MKKDTGVGFEQGPSGSSERASRLTDGSSAYASAQCCADWVPMLAKVNAPHFLASARSGGKYQYDGKPFAFCPWCGAGKTTLPLPTYARPGGKS